MDDESIIAVSTSGSTHKNVNGLAEVASMDATNSAVIDDATKTVDTCIEHDTARDVTKQPANHDCGPVDSDICTCNATRDPGNACNSATNINESQSETTVANDKQAWMCFACKYFHSHLLICAESPAPAFDPANTDTPECCDLKSAVAAAGFLFTMVDGPVSYIEYLTRRSSPKHMYDIIKRLDTIAADRTTVSESRQHFDMPPDLGRSNASCENCGHALPDNLTVHYSPAALATLIVRLRARAHHKAHLEELARRYYYYWHR
ncbi:hypothetical protein EDC01DRAFT_743774 [Geopyxis carbonaria]|nr:hypothetical protein EDC01DRAFT_743774 [Geopyxis carbonaria]